MNKELLEHLKNIASKHELNYFKDDLNKDFLQTEISIAFLGEFSAGKSTLANVFLGKKVLPALDKPTTANIIEISYGEEFKAFVYQDSKIKEISLKDLDNFVINSLDNIDKIIIKTPETDFIKPGIKIIDTPGISSLNDLHDDITFGYLPFVDVSLILIRITSGLTESIFNFLKEKLTKEELSNIFFVLNFSDLKKPSSVKIIVDELKNNLSQIIEEPVVIPISSKEALNNNIEKSNINELKNYLYEKVINVKEKLIMSKNNKKIMLKNNNLINLLKLKLDNLNSTDLDTETNNIKKEINELTSLKKELLESLNIMKRDANTFIDNLSSKYSNDIINSYIQKNKSNLNIIYKNISKDLEEYINTHQNKIVTKTNNILSLCKSNNSILLEDLDNFFKETKYKINNLYQELLNKDISLNQVRSFGIGLLSKIAPDIYLSKVNDKKQEILDIFRQTFNSKFNELTNIINNFIENNVINYEKEKEKIFNQISQKKLHNFENIKNEIINDIKLLESFKLQ